jgi:hypothetical protein
MVLAHVIGRLSTITPNRSPVGPCTLPDWLKRTRLLVPAVFSVLKYSRFSAVPGMQKPALAGWPIAWPDPE